ncbi:MAG TPA: alcohol dehydrogenase catalytic domain-containing protein [Mycobacteriales bacterium]|nr:alcohol dehydrogenase catalytic domain-containing protein [Mycobacteriales bacterium]
MPRTAPAPVFHGQGRISFQDHEYREPGPGELLLAPRANALCGTDRGFYYGGARHIPGHETAGVVLAAGPETTTAAGTPGVVFLMDFCGTCRSCRIGATNQCLAKRADMGIADDGGFGPYEIVHESNFFPVPADLDLGLATMLLDVMGTSGHALGRAELVRTDIDSILITGAGPIGIGLLSMAKVRYGAEFPVYISDVSPWRRELAASLGGTPVAADAVGTIGPVDAAFDASGRESARRSAVDALSQRGMLVCVGHGESVTLEVSGDLIAPERAVLGSEYFRYDELAANLQLLQANQELFGRVITHRFSIEQIGDAFELFFAGETAKVVVTQEAHS